jgi:preprotein translocase subunit YajC
MSPSSLFATLFAQVTNAAPAADASGATPASPPWYMSLYMPVLLIAMVYFALIRPQQQAKKKAEETIKGAKTGDKIVTTSGIHGVITNVKDSTVILKIADNVKIEVEKSHIDKITRPDTSPSPEKIGAAKA